MAIIQPPQLAPMVDDPDDYRPDSRWALLTDPGSREGTVEDLCAILEEVAPGDRIPLHRHDIDEIVFIIAGEAEVTLGQDRFRPPEGSVVFIPARAIHGHKNVGSEVLQVQAVFPSTVIDIEMLERNPAPGTEQDAPSSTVYNARTGEFWPKGRRDSGSG